MITEQQIKKLVSELEAFYGSKVMNGGILESLWIQTLQQLSIEQLEDAIASCFSKNPKSHGFFPSPQQLLEYVKGEYRPPGENKIQGDLNIPALQSVESKLTPEQIKELQLRGRLQAKILAYGGRFMSTEEKDAFIDSLRLKPTYELEHIAGNAEQSMSNIKDSGKGLEHLAESFKLIKDKLNHVIN